MDHDNSARHGFRWAGRLGGMGKGWSAGDWLSLAASPAFATMAVVLLLTEEGPDILCRATSPHPWSGMALMYALMCAFHSAPWLRLLLQPNPVQGAPVKRNPR